MPVDSVAGRIILPTNSTGRIGERTNLAHILIPAQRGQREFSPVLRHSRAGGNGGNPALNPAFQGRTKQPENVHPHQQRLQGDDRLRSSVSGEQDNRGPVG